MTPEEVWLPKFPDDRHEPKLNVSLVPVPGWDRYVRPQEGTTMWLCVRKGEACAAYPRKLQAEVYASGFSRADVEVI